MPIYEFRCKECGLTNEMSVSYKDRPETLSCSCGGTAEHVISQSAFVLKGHDWPGQSAKTKSFRAQRYEEMGRRQAAAGHKTPSLAPNFGGKVCDSWSQAATLASDAGKDVGSYLEAAKKAGEQTS